MNLANGDGKAIGMCRIRPQCRWSRSSRRLSGGAEPRWEAADGGGVSAAWTAGPRRSRGEHEIAPGQLFTWLRELLSAEIAGGVAGDAKRQTRKGRLWAYVPGLIASR